MTRQLNSPIVPVAMKAYHRTAIDLHFQITGGKILLDPPYQRGSVWTEDQRLDLMYSMLSGFPIGAIILNDRMNGTWGFKVAYAVIDGRQRLETISAWFSDGLRIPISWVVPEAIRDDAQAYDTGDGLYVHNSDLTPNGQAEIESRMSVSTMVANVNSLAGEAEIYRLVNAGGTAHTADDMTRAAAVEAAGPPIDRACRGCGAQAGEKCRWPDGGTCTTRL